MDAGKSKLIDLLREQKQQSRTSTPIPSDVLISTSSKTPKTLSKRKHRLLKKRGNSQIKQNIFNTFAGQFPLVSPPVPRTAATSPIRSPLRAFNESPVHRFNDYTAMRQTPMWLDASMMSKDPSLNVERRTISTAINNNNPRADTVLSTPHSRK